MIILAPGIIKVKTINLSHEDRHIIQKMYAIFIEVEGCLVLGSINLLYNETKYASHHIFPIAGVISFLYK